MAKPRTVTSERGETPDLAGRICELERIVQRLVKCSAVRHEVLRVERAEAAAAQDLAFCERQQATRRAGGPARLRRFREFIAQRCVIGPGQVAITRALWRCYCDFVDRCTPGEGMSESEFQEAVRGLAGVTHGEAVNHLGRALPSIRGIAVRSNHRPPRDATPPARRRIRLHREPTPEEFEADPLLRLPPEKAKIDSRRPSTGSSTRSRSDRASRARGIRRRAGSAGRRSRAARSAG